jgi:hypothetical protein
VQSSETSLKLISTIHLKKREVVDLQEEKMGNQRSVPLHLRFQVLMVRCQDQHVTTNTLSEEAHVVINKTQKRAQWICQDGVEVLVEVDEGVLPEEGAVGQEDEEVHPVEEVEEVKLLLPNVLASLGESSLFFLELDGNGSGSGSMVLDLCILYMTIISTLRSDHEGLSELESAVNEVVR